MNNRIRYGIIFNNEDDCTSSDASIGIGVKSHRGNIAAGGKYGCCASNGKKQDVIVTAKIYVANFHIGAKKFNADMLVHLFFFHIFVKKKDCQSRYSFFV